MSHHHDHDHNHDHSHSHAPQNSALSFEDKIKTLLNHWIQHNNDHASSYMKWAAQASENNHKALAEKLKEAARAELAINEIFKAAEKLVGKP